MTSGRTNRARLLQVAVFVIAALLNARWAAVAPLMTENDPIEYWEVARNLFAGRGLVSGITWQYLTSQQAAVHPSNDYWMPLASLVLAPFVELSPIDGGLATTPFVLIGALAAVLVFRLGQGLLADHALAFVIAVLFASRFCLVASTFESTALYVPLLLGVSLTWAGAAGRPGEATMRDGLVLGLLGGLCLLTRSDSVAVLVLMLGGAWLVSRWARVPVPDGAVFRWALVPFVSTAVAWAIRSHVAFGTWWNPSSGKTAFLRSYRQLFELHAEVGPGSYLREMVLSAPGAFVVGKLQAIWLELWRFLETAGPAGAVPIAVGAAVLVRSRHPVAIASASLVGALVMTYGGIATAFASIGGGFRSASAMTPFAWASLLAGARAILVDLLATRPQGRRRAESLLRASALLFAAWTVWPVLTPPRGASAQASRLALVRPVAAALDQLAIGRQEPLLTTQPFLVRAATGRPAAILPLDGVPSICEVAGRIGARYLLLIDDRVYFGIAGGTPLRDWLTGRGELPAEFEPVGQGPSWRLLRLRCRPASETSP